MVSILHLLLFNVKVSVSSPTLIFMFWLFHNLANQYLKITPKLICAYFATHSKLTFTEYKAILWTKDLFVVF